ncbi:MAG: outer membrane lipoprotein-sorting protein [Pikeienuella sp.]
MPVFSTPVSRRRLLSCAGASLTTALFAPNLVFGATDAMHVAREINDIERTAAYSAFASVQLIRTGSQVRNRGLNVSAARQGEESLSLRRYEFTDPGDIRGTKFLVQENAGEDNSLWLMLPSVGKVRRVSSSNQSDAFAGTDFSYANLMTLDLDEFDHVITDQSGDSLVLESTVKSESFADNIGYARVVTAASAESMIPSRFEYFDRQGRAIKTQTVDQPAPAPDGKYILQSRRMTVHGKGRETLISLSKLDFSPNFSRDHFRSQGL